MEFLVELHTNQARSESDLHSCEESPENKSEASMGFQPMTSVIPV